MEYEIYKTDNELYHWGVLGMKWGVRRYQRKDGSLTPAGERRLKKERAELRKEEQVLKNRKATKAKLDRIAAKRKSLEEQKKALDGDDAKAKKGKSEDAKAAKKSIKDMSDDELIKAVNRGRLEEAYRQLYPEPPVKQSLLNKTLNDVVIPAATTSGKQFLQNALSKAGENLLKGKVDPNSVEALTKIRDKLKLQTEIEEFKNGGKYNWENMLKKQQYEKQAADRNAQMKGFKDAVDEFQATRKAAADEAARKANESKSREYYDAAYSKKTGEKTTVGSTSNNYVQKLLGGETATTALTTTSNVSSGKSTISGLLTGSTARRNANEVGYIDKDGKFHAY